MLGVPALRDTTDAKTGVTALKDITETKAAEILPKPFRDHARHVLTENYRVLEALQGITPERFGEFMNASHASLRDDYEVSVPALDILVEILQPTPGVFGARLTGAGFGGACVALVTSRQGREIVTKVVEEYKYTGYKGEIVVPTINL